MLRLYRKAACRYTFLRPRNQRTVLCPLLVVLNYTILAISGLLSHLIQFLWYLRTNFLLSCGFCFSHKSLNLIIEDKITGTLSCSAPSAMVSCRRYILAFCEHVKSLYSLVLHITVITNRKQSNRMSSFKKHNVTNIIIYHGL